MIPRLKPLIGVQEMLALLPSLKSRSETVSRFEHEFANLMSLPYAVAFPYGRSALYALLNSCGIKGKEVLCPAYTCVVVPHAIVASGNTPVFVDIESDSLNMDVQLVEEGVSDLTAAVIPTSVFGRPVDTNDWASFRKSHADLNVFQDCAYSYAASSHGQEVQHCGDAAFVGTNISKLITSIFGGLAVTASPEIYQALLKFRREQMETPSLSKSFSRAAYFLAISVAFSPVAYGAINAIEEHGWIDRFVKYYDEGTIELPKDFLTGLTALEARIGIQQVKRYAGIVEHRRSLARMYSSRLSELEGVRIDPFDEGHTYSQYPVIFPDRQTAEAVVAACRLRGVQLGTLLEYCNPDMRAYHGSRFIGPGRSSRVPGRIVNLPVHLGVRFSHVDMLCDVIVEILRG